MEKQTVTYRLGTGGWEHEIFDQCLYPRRQMTSAEKLRYYSYVFDTVEVRQTFWDDSLDADDAREWIDAVAENRKFVLSVKLHSSFTHKKEIRTGIATSVRSVLQELARNDRLGSLVAQFPFSFTNTSAHRYHLTRLSEVFRGFPIVVELRHESWHQPSLRRFFDDHALETVSTDFPRLRHYMPFSTRDSGQRAYMRLHGRNEKGWLLNGQDVRYDYLYNGKELRELQRRVDALSSTVRHVSIIFNNTTGGKAVANALQLTAALRKTRTVAVPPAALTAFPFLHSLSGSCQQDASLLELDCIRRVV